MAEAATELLTTADGRPLKADPKESRRRRAERNARR